MNRRGFLTGLSALVAAPAIIRPGLLMPIKPSLVPVRYTTGTEILARWRTYEREITGYKIGDQIRILNELWRGATVSALAEPNDDSPRR